MAVVRRSSVLPIDADTAFRLAQSLDLFAFVVAPWLRVRGVRGLPPQLAAGVEGSARLWWLGVVPSWRHHLKLVHIADGEIRTEEHGGPVRTWNHHLTFEPLADGRCRYTDTIELDDTLFALPTRLFARAMFRHRHHRWATLAALVRTAAPPS
jgi:hypothetical protein